MLSGLNLSGALPLSLSGITNSSAANRLFFLHLAKYRAPSKVNIAIVDTVVMATTLLVSILFTGDSEGLPVEIVVEEGWIGDTLKWEVVAASVIRVFACARSVK